MKFKITLLTTAVLIVILVIFDLFVFLSLRSHLYHMQSVAMETESNAIVQYYWATVSDQQGPGNTGSSSIPLSWLQKYQIEGQTVAIVNESGALIQKVGNDSFRELQNMFHVATSQHSTEISSNSHGHLRMMVVSPLTDPTSKKIIGYVLILKHGGDVQDYLRTLLFFLFLGTIGAVILAGFGGYFTAATTLERLTKLVRFVQRMQVTNLQERVAVPRHRDEVGTLAIAFNGMLERMERSFQQQSQFIADASHELRTPLTMIQGYANLLKRWGKNDPHVLDKGLEVINKESTRLISLAEDLLLLARMELVSREETPECDLDDVIRETVDAMMILHPTTTFSLDLSVSRISTIGSAAWKQVLTNLIENAIKYSEALAKVHISTRHSGSLAVIEVKDEGRGIPETDLPFIFERFYRVDDARTLDESGTGLGLAIVKAIVELYGGEITVHSKVNEGTTCRLTLLLRPED